MLGIRSKTIIAIVAVILTISTSYFFFFVKQRDHSQQLVIKCKKEMVTALVASLTREISNQYNSRIKSFAQHQKKIIQAFAKHDRDQLYEETLPVYKLLQNENKHFDHINFVLPDNTVFLRMQKPEQYGDQEQFSCRVYSDVGPELENGESGFVYGTCGLLFRVIQPLFYQDEFIGKVLFGIRMGSFVDDIKENLEMHTAFAIRKDLVDNLEEGHHDGVVSGNYVIHDFEDPFFKDKAGRIEATRDGQKFTHNGEDHFVFPSYIINDKEGQEIGRILQGVDLTTIIASYRLDIIRLSIITLCVLILASLILYLAFSKLLGEFVHLNRKLQEKNVELMEAGQQLEEQVLKRTNELGAANARLINEIEERQEANLSLVRSIGEWQSTFDAIADPVTILDPDLEVVIANKAAQNLLRRDDKEIVGRPCHELFAGNPNPCELCPVTEVFASGVKTEQEVEHEYLGKNMLVSCMPIYDKDVITGYIHTARDITEEKILKKQLSQAQKMEAIATLAGGIAHDFNNILGAILGNADLLLYRLASPVAESEQKNLQELSSEEIATHIAAIKKAGNRAKELVSQILAFSRQSKSQRQSVLITPVIKEGIKLLRSSLAANIEIVSSVDPEPFHINADLSQIHQVFMNFCTNAAQAMAEKGGVLDISLQNFEADSSTRKRYPDLNPGEYLALGVKDTGHGMSPEILERIFDPFFTTRDVGDGTGMGLSVIHGIITSHDGILDVKSEVDVGSEFTVFFPRVGGGHTYGEDPVLGVPRGEEKILFVDDELDIVKMSGSMLQYLGYTIFSATSGEKALEMLRGEASDVNLVICDYSMPGMSGIDMATEIIQIRHDLPVILCSGFSESVVLDEKAKKVIRKFMSKPLDMKKLAIAIREVLS